MSDLARQAALLRRAIRPAGGPADPAGTQATAPREGLDLGSLYSLSVAHCVVPLVERRLRALPEPAATAAPERRLFSRHVQVGALRSAFLEQRLSEVLESLGAAGIRALVYKGPALARLAYGDLALRGFGDLDLLCSPSDVPAAVEALGALDYRGVPRLEPWRLRKALALDCQYAVERAAGDVRLEIHWGVVRPPFGRRPDFDRLWERRIAVRANAFEIPSPSPADLFVLLAVHGFKHCWSRLGWIADLLWLAGAVDEARGGGWPAVAELARELDFEIEVELARELLRRFGRSAAARSERSEGAGGSEVGVPRVVRLADTVESRLFPPAGEPGAAVRLAFLRAGRTTIAVQARLFARLAWMPALDDLAAPRLPRLLFPLYYPLRPLLLLLKRGGSGH
jgi:hypothetical protein